MPTIQICHNAAEHYAPFYKRLPDDAPKKDLNILIAKLSDVHGKPDALIAEKKLAFVYTHAGTTHIRRVGDSYVVDEGEKNFINSRVPGAAVISDGGADSTDAVVKELLKERDGLLEDVKRLSKLNADLEAKLEASDRGLAAASERAANLAKERDDVAAALRAATPDKKGK